MALQGVELSVAQAAPVLFMMIGALARHLPAAEPTPLSGRTVPTTRDRLQEASTLRGERLSRALDALCARGLIDLEQTAAGLSLRIAEEGCASHPLLAAVPWDHISARVGGGEGGGTAALALLAELVLLAEAIGEAEAPLPPILRTGARRDGLVERELRVTPDFQAIAVRTRYSRTRLAQATRVLHEAGVVVWDGARGVRGTVTISPWVIGQAPLPSGPASGGPLASERADAREQRESIGRLAPESTGQARAGAASGRRVWIGDTPLVVAPGTPIDLTARTPDGRPGVRVVVHGVEIVVDVGEG